MRFRSAELRLDQLLLDDANPRLPENLLGSSQAAILRWMFEEGVLEELAVSFLDHGYLEAEPLFVLAGARPDTWVVLEGNRRLATLMTLTGHPTALEAEVEFKLSEAPTTSQLANLAVIPVRIVDSREDVREYVGFRHIGGIKEWPPEAKARWIEDEITRRSGKTSRNVFADIGRTVGTNAQSIRGPYLALRILRHGLEELESIFAQIRFVQENRFGVFVRATNSPDLRAYLSPEGPPSLRTIDDIEAMVTAIDVGHLSRVLSDLVPPPGRRSAVLSDSRDVTTYARALQHPVANKVLIEYADLALARQILDRQDLPQRIRGIETSVRIMLDEVQRDLEVPPPGSHDASKGLLAAAQSLEVQLASRVPASS